MTEPPYAAEPDPAVDLSQLPISGDWTPYVELLGIGGFVRHPFTPMLVCEISPLRTDNPDATRPRAQAVPPMELPSTKTPEMQQTATRLQMPTTRTNKGSDAKMTEPKPCPNCGTQRPMPGDETLTFPRKGDVREQLADIAALFRTAADSDGEYALAELFEYLRDYAAIVVDRPDLATIVKRLHTWAKE